MIDGKILLNILVKKKFGPPLNNIAKISTDSRTIKENEVFLALAGEKFDGADYANEVAKRLPSAIIVNFNEKNSFIAESLSSQYPNLPIFLVENTLKYLQKVARDHMQLWKDKDEKRRLIGITGSNGKTSNKEMLFHLLNSIFPGKVLATQGNLNNHIGVPKTLLELTDNHSIAIVEMGTNHPGEIADLCRIALPDAGFITNIGNAHIEFLGDLNGVFLEKRALFDSVYSGNNADPHFVVCADDPYLNQLPHLPGTIFFGENAGDCLLKINKSDLTFKYLDINYNLRLPQLFGRHNLKNMACCLLLAAQLFPNQIPYLILSAEKFSPPNNNRAQWVSSEDRKFLLDAYNANPSSMKASLSAFFEYLLEKKCSMNEVLFILGDMNELGQQGPDLHREIGKLLNDHGAINVCFVGRFSAFYKEGFPNGKVFGDRLGLLKEWPKLKKDHQLFFLKGSRTLQLETLLDINIAKH